MEPTRGGRGETIKHDVPLDGRGVGPALYVSADQFVLWGGSLSLALAETSFATTRWRRKFAAAKISRALDPGLPVVRRQPSMG